MKNDTRIANTRVSSTRVTKYFVVFFIIVYLVVKTVTAETPDAHLTDVHLLQQDGATSVTTVLSSQLKTITNKFHKTLNFSPLFIVSNLLDPQKMRAHLLRPFIGGGKIITATTTDGEKINCTFFDRNSDKLLIIGTGFGNEREKVAPLVHMFDTYDVVIFDYRGHGYEQPKLLDTSQWTMQPSQQLRETIEQLTPILDWSRIPNINLNKTTFGLSEENDLLAVISNLKSQKTYTRTYGIGFCFSSFVFTKAAALNPGLFDKLILDSSLYSLQTIIDRITQSPQLLFDPQKGLWASVIKVETGDGHKVIVEAIKELIAKNLLTQLATTFLQNAFANLEVTPHTTGDYLSQLTNLPILFFHGKNDKMTPYDQDLLKNFASVQTEEKAAIIFENSKHLINHIKYKELYKGISTLFFELPHASFISCLKEPQKFIAHELTLMQEELRTMLYPKPARSPA